MIYVDSAIWPFKRMIMCHLIADTHEELIEITKKIKVAKKWIQKEGTYREHFDICKSKRVLAIKHGAKEVNNKEFMQIMQAKI